MKSERLEHIRNYFIYPSEEWDKDSLVNYGIELLSEIDRLKGFCEGMKIAHNALKETTELFMDRNKG